MLRIGQRSQPVRRSSALPSLRDLPDKSANAVAIEWTFELGANWAAHINADAGAGSGTHCCPDVGTNAGPDASSVHCVSCHSDAIVGAYSNADHWTCHTGSNRAAAVLGET